MTLDFGGQVHTLRDYVGSMAGMPRVVTQFEDEIDDAADSAGWISFGTAALQQLKAKGFNFRSQAGADLLARAVANAGADDQAILALVELRAPINGAKLPADMDCCLPKSLLDAALVNRRSIALIDALISKGALQTRGTPDQSKIDAAFRAAIMGGRLELVHKVWSIGATTPHPALMFNDVSEDKNVRKQSPVTLRLRHHPFQEAGWEGLAIAKWLIAQGCDLKARGADGKTLLHIATDAADLEFVRYLLDQGFDPSTPGPYGLPALGSAKDEDIAVTLLEAGTDLTLMDDKGNQFRRYAEYNHWGRVIAWLDAH
jgi:ankyrin repeat protein